MMGNIQQRVFDAVPLFPAAITLDSICAVVPFDRYSVRSALVRLGRLKLVRFHGGVYRRWEHAGRPDDGRVGNLNAKRRGSG